MAIPEPQLRPGDLAPDFSLPAVDRDGTVSLGDYRGRSPLLLAFFRGNLLPVLPAADRQAGTGAGQAPGRRGGDTRRRGE
jgi:hypothetical protein